MYTSSTRLCVPCCFYNTAAVVPFLARNNCASCVMFLIMMLFFINQDRVHRHHHKFRVISGRAIFCLQHCILVSEVFSLISKCEFGGTVLA